MTTVVADTSPINYLVLIGVMHVLPEIFQQVLIPPAVLRELQHVKTPKVVYAWAQYLPPWAKIQKPNQIDSSIGLGAGENEAISLAVERQIPILLIDDRQGWLAAEARSILPVGTLNLLESAARRKLLNFETSVAALQQTNFRIERSILETALRRMRPE